MKGLILLADDDEATRTLLRNHLQQQGYLVTTVDDGTEAVLKIKEIKPNLLILDVQMPGAYGPTVYASLQEDPELAKIPVLFISGHASSELVNRRVPLGPRVRFLPKPLEFDELDTEVASLLDGAGGKA